MRTEKQLNNLKSFKRGEYSEIQKAGNKASAERRRDLKEIKEWAQQNLFRDVGQNKIPLYEMLFKKLEQLSSQGNLKAIEMLLNYSGLKPIDKIENINPQVQKIFITKEDTKKANKLIDEFIEK